MLLTLIGWMIGIALYLVVGGAVAEWTKSRPRDSVTDDWKAIGWPVYLLGWLWVWLVVLLWRAVELGRRLARRR